MSQNTSHRIGFKFWLNLDKKSEEAIADQIEHLKSNRSFTETIRNGIRLIVNLSNGKTDVLLELYPWVQTKLQSSSGSNDNGDIKREIANLQSLILQQSSSTDSQIMKPVSGGLQPLQGLNPIAPPAYDEDEDDMILSVTKAVGDGKAAHKFLEAMQALQQ